MRKMLSVQTVENLSPIVNGDFIEVCRIQGWNVVVEKDKFSVGDKVAYFEINSFLPNGDPRFESFQSRGQNVLVTSEGEEINGHVISTMKFRGVYSQGAVMGLDELGYTAGHIDELNVGDDISETVGIVKWEEPIPEDESIIGQFDSRWMPKTGSERVQNLSENWDEITSLKWEATLKIDGTSQTLLNDGENVKIFGHNWELDKNESPGYAVALANGLVAEIEKHPKMAVQFELAGPGISKNRLKLAEKQAFVFSVWVDGEKLERSEWPEAILKVATPVIEGYDLAGSLDEMIENVSTLRGNTTKGILDEGLVYHLLSDEVPMWMTRNASIKLVSNKYIVKHKL